jgi:ATP-dependent DNA helicase RecQ
MTPLNSIENMVFAKEDLYFSLQKFFGFDRFKGNQEEIIQSVLSGRDTFVILPTGGGKSLCYQLPALMLEGTAIIISPLIALMKNQVDSIRGHSQTDEIAHFLNSSLSRAQTKDVKSDIIAGHTKMLYSAPETLTKAETLDFLLHINVSFVAIDEAHCISEWGHDFRPEYRRIRSMIESMNKEIPIIALTATATPKVRLDIVKTLRMDEPNEFVSSFNRDNLYYEVRPKGKKEDVFKNIVQFIKNQITTGNALFTSPAAKTADDAKILEAQIRQFSKSQFEQIIDELNNENPARNLKKEIGKK